MLPIADREFRDTTNPNDIIVQVLSHLCRVNTRIAQNLVSEHDRVTTHDRFNSIQVDGIKKIKQTFRSIEKRYNLDG